MSQQDEPITIVGGGPKKVLYTLKTLARIGLRDSAKALRANNACKACGLGMGGQRGGMTNELGEFPSVCNKSVQAQSTDIQPPIPSELFKKHTLNDFRELSAHELEHLGRLGAPLYKAKNAEHYTPISWDDAIEKMASQFQQTLPARSFFYASGRSSNEAGFLLQLIARLYGTNNVNNCSYYCHQATGVGLNNTIGSGTATVTLADLGKSDCIVVIGANPSSNHPRFIHQLMHCRERGGQVIVINPAREPGLVKFAVPKSAKSMLKGGSDIASDYVQPKIGSDLVLLQGIAKALIGSGKIDNHFIDNFTEGFTELTQSLDAIGWQTITNATGINQQAIEQLADKLASAKNVVFAWGMGITHHQHGVDNVEAIANLALLLGMIGREGAGLLPLRGHSNVQGMGTVGVKPALAEPVLKRLEQKLNFTLPKSKGLDTLACLQASFNGEVDAALFLGGNLYSASPNSEWTKTALSNIGFKVYLTTTLNAGHFNGLGDGEVLVLPVCARDEESEPTTQESMFNYVRLSDGGISRIAGAKPETSVLAAFGEKLLQANSQLQNGAFDFAALKSHDAIRRLISECLPELAPLNNIAESKQEFTIQGRVLHQPQFNTPNQKARFCLPKSGLATQDPKYPFLLASIRSEGQFNSIIYEPTDSYRHHAPRNAVLMNTEDMAALGVKRGDNVLLQSIEGRLQCVAHPFDVPTGNALAYYPEANVLIGLASDARSKTPAFKSVPVAISPLAVGA